MQQPLRTAWFILFIGLISSFGALAQSMTVTSFSPSAGAPGGTVTIYGAHFTTEQFGEGIDVSFSGGAWAWAYASDYDSELTVTIPSGAQSGPITISSSNGSATTGYFTVIDGCTSVTVGITPAGPINLNGGSATLTAQATAPLFRRGFNDEVMRLAQQPDGKLLVAGGFDQFDDVAARILTRLNTNGTRDNTFTQTGAGFNNTVQGMALQADGKIVVGGFFYSYNGTSLGSIARMNANGTLDNTFNSGGSGFDGFVYTVAVQADGKILVGGNYNSYNGNAAAPDYLVRLNADGTLDSGFNSGGSGIGGFVTALAVQPDGKIVVGGNFFDYNGGAAPLRVLRLNANGTLDNTFNNGGSGLNGIAQSVALQADGKILVGGSFTSYNGNAAAPDNLLRLNADGTLDNTFNSSGAGTNGEVKSLAVQADGKIVAGGSFTSYNGGTAPAGLLRLTTTGSLDNTFNSGGAGVGGAGGYALVVQPDGKIVLGGTFTSYNLSVVGRIVRANADGSLDNTLTPLAGATYIWSPGNQTTASITVSQAGTYSVEATSGDCVVQSNSVTLLSGTAPTALALSNNSVAENAVASTTVGTFSTTDADAGDTFTYTLVSGTGAAGNAAFTISGNVLRTAAAFDYEAQSSYSIRVRTTDQYNLWFEQAFTITVTNVNELTLTASQTNSSCPGGNGSATVTPAGEPGPYTYSWTPAGLSGNGTATVTGLAAGSYSVLVTATATGFTATQSFTITSVPDVTLPVVVAQNASLTLNAVGKATLLASAVNNGSSDNCGAVTLSVSPSAFTCANVGPNTVTLTVRDAAGNQNTATATVTVIDNTAPTVYCQPITRQLGTNGQVSITAADLVAPPVIGLAAGAGSLGSAGNNDVAVGDLDGDGDPDVVYANNGQSAVYLNDGAGNFTPHPTTPLLGSSSDAHRGVALGDVDGDGDLDLVFAVVGSDETVYANNGSGAFTLLGSFAGLATTYDVALADIDADGDLDAAVINDGSLQLWKNNGSGTFTVSGSTLGSLTGHQWQVQFARLNADAAPDLLISGEDGRAESVFLNNGTGTFAAQPTTPTFGGGSFNLTNAVGDVDGDGDLDVVYPNGSSVVVWYNTSNTGAFANPQTFATAQSSYDVLLFDIDKDGDLDIVMGSGPLQVLLNNGAGSFTALPNTANAGVATMYVLAAADFDGDGLTDVVGGRFALNSGLNYFRNNTARTADICGGLTLTASKLAFDCTNLGTNTVTLTGTDGSGNAASCQAVVTIQDVTAPVAVARNTSVTLGANGTATLTAADINNGSTDNCGIASMSISPNTFSCSTPTTTTPNNYGLRFDGSNDYFSLGSVLTNDASYTKELWVKATDTDCRNLLSGNNQHELWLISGTLRAGHGTSYSVVQDPTAFPLDTWVHVAVSYDAASHTMKLYRDGILVDSNSGAAVPAYATIDAQLGAHGGGCTFSGEMDEVRIWSTVRTDAEILNSKNQSLTGTEAGLLAYYNFEDGASSPTTLVDISGHGYTGTQPTASQRPTWVAGTAPVTSPALVTVTLTVRDATGNSNTATAYVAVQQPSAASVPVLTWTGTASTSWSDCGNWSYGLVPTSSHSVTIPAGLSRYPTLSAGTATVTSLTIASGASLTLASGATLQASGNVDNQGPTLAGTVRLNGTGAQTAVGSFGTLVVNKTSGTTTLSGSASVATALTMTAGTLSTSSYTVTLAPTATLTESTTSYVTGTVQTTRNLNNTSVNDFGGLGLTLTPSGSTLPGSTLVRRTTGTALTGALGRQGIQRYFDIQPTVNSGLNVALVFNYLDSELNGIAESNLTFFRSTTGTSGPWQRITYTSRNATTNTVTVTGVDHFSVWTLGSSTAPLPVELTAFTAVQEGSAALLRWNTAQEKSNDHFEVEASVDGVGFARIGTVAGQGTKTSSTDYRFEDKKLLSYGTALVYYRLRQVDLDGTATYSEVRSVRVSEGTERPQLAVYPTVAESGQPVQYCYTGPVLPTGTTLEVFDALGRQVGQQAATAAGTLATQKLAVGWYWVRLSTANGTVQARFYQP